jgi:gluconolactonase
MRTRSKFSLAQIAITAAFGAAAAAADFTIIDEAEFKAILGPEAKVTKLADGFRFTEGPVWLDWDGGFLLFSDIPANHLKKWQPRAGITIYREDSRNANGNNTDRTGRLVTAEHSGRRISLTERSGTVTTVVDRHDGKRFNSPNDVVVKSDGTFWFTDPPYGLPRGETKEQPGNYVYRYDPKSKATSALVTDFDMPNGLCFSPDESKLYVADSGKPHHIRVFDVKADGTVTAGKVFCTIDKGGPDGIRADEHGRIWSSSGDGAQVFASNGALVARILLPKGAANLCFGGPKGTTLFLTARDALYSVETKVKDARR